MRTNEERLKELLAFLNTQTHVKPEQIPDIDLYMDQVTTFMEEHLRDTKRHPDDKVLTKTMINNYAKNKLLPPPEKNVTPRSTMYMLIFIYYLKGFLPLTDIQAILNPSAMNFSAVTVIFAWKIFIKKSFASVKKISLISAMTSWKTSTISSQFF